MGYTEKTVLIHRERPEGTIGVYVHIPYCINKCPYCDFKSIVTAQIPEKDYIECVLKELSSFLDRECLKKRPRLESLYIGGGTPSLFSPDSIGMLVDGVKAALEPEDCEVTIEANPDTVDLGKLAGFLRRGVNRISIGAQSLDNRDLKALGRTHSAEKAAASIKLAKDAGFENIGADLIFGVPGQDLKRWEDSLYKLMELRPQHISVYWLTIEEGTPFHKLYGNRGMKDPDDAEEADMYNKSAGLLTAGGWAHYEISNFGLPGYLSRHNSRYWLGGGYLGIGVSAHSYLSCQGWGRRWWNDIDPLNYMRRIKDSGTAKAGEEALSREQAMLETMMLGLRMLEGGLRGESFKKRFGEYPKMVFKRWKELKDEGLLSVNGEDMLLTPGGAILSNEIFLRMAE